jgi:hypothetical protein
MTRMMKHTIVCVLGILLCVGPAGAEGLDADGHFKKAVQLANASEFEGALAEFEAAFTLSQHPRVLYNMAKVALEMQDRGRAVAYLERYLSWKATPLPEAEAKEVRETLAALQANGKATGGEARTPEVLPEPGLSPPEVASSAALLSQPDEKQAGGSAANGPTTAPKSMPERTAGGTPPGGRLPEPRRPLQAAARGVNVPAVVLLAAGGGVLVAGGGVWLWNDNEYRSALEERTQLREHPPTATKPSDLGDAVDYGRRVGRNQERLGDVHQLDILAWSMMGVGVLCIATSVWMLLDSSQAPSKTLALEGQRLVLHW